MNTKVQVKSNKYFIIAAALIIAATLSTMNFYAVFADTGSIWTTDDTDQTQDKNEYNEGEGVFVRVDNLDPNTEYDFSVTGQPGGASSDPNVEVNSGKITTDENGNYWFLAYTVEVGDDGEYKVRVNGKQDNYRVDGAQEDPPADIPGCTDPSANNFNAEATVDNGSCTYDENPPEDIPGCIDPSANNYNVEATVDNGSCTYDENPPQEPPSSPPPSTPFLIPVTGVDQSSSLWFSIVSLLGGIGSLVKGLFSKS